MKKLIFTLNLIAFFTIHSLAQCPTLATDASGGGGAQYNFTVANCAPAVFVFGSNYTTTGGATFSSQGCTAPTLSATLIAGVPDPLPMTIDFGGAVGSCEYDAAGNLVTMPVELMTFYAQTTNNSIELIWKTASEENNQGFQIEHSTDAKDWKNIGFVEGAGTTTEVQYYSFKNTEPKLGVNYFRLKQIDFNGVFEYSNTITRNFERNTNPLTLSPNPVQNQLNIQNGIGKAVIYNIVGQAIHEFNITENQTSKDLSDLEAGQYIFKLTKDNGEVITKRFVK